MKNFYSFYRKLKEYLAVGTENDFGESVDTFLAKYTDKRMSDEDRLLPMLVAADIMDELFHNSPKADKIREDVRKQDFFSLVTACENFKKHGFFTFNKNYMPNLTPMIVVFSDNYPLESIVGDDETGSRVRINAIAPVTDEKRREAIKSQMSVDYYFRNKVEDFDPTFAFVNMDSADLEFFPQSRGQLFGGLQSIVSPNGNLKRGPYTDIHERIKPSWLNIEFPEIFGEGLASGRFFVVNDLEDNHVG